MSSGPIGPRGKPVIITAEGALAYLIENQTGEVSVKGKIVEPSVTVDRAVELIAADEPDPVGIIYDAGVAVGGLMRVVFSGMVPVLFGNTPIRHYFARNSISTDAVAAGLAISEPLPSPPLATDKHFLEIGHIFETLGAPGLALVNVHFN